MARIAVVGGGFAGLASAARLAKIGHQVTVLEQRDEVGGVLGFLDQDGYRWNTGPHTTTLPAVLRDLFRKSGRPLEREAELSAVPVLREHRFADGTRVRLPSGSRADQVHALDDALGAGSGRAWVDYVHHQSRAWDLLRRDVLERPYVAAVAGRETAALLGSRVSLQRAVTRALSDPRLRTMAWHHAIQNGQRPRDVPAWWGMLDYVEQSFGTWTLPGGLGALAPLLRKRLTERRVEVLCGTRVDTVVMGPGGPRAVRTGNGEIETDLVVVACDPAGLPELARHVRRTRPTTPGAVTHLGLRGDPEELAHEVVFHNRGLRLHTDDTAQPGRTAWTIQSRGRAAADPVAALAHCGIDVADRIEVRVDRSAAELVGTYGGSPYGVQWRGRRTLTDRIGPRTPLPGVYAVGAHTAGGGWLPFVGLTATVVADLIGSP